MRERTRKSKRDWHLLSFFPQLLTAQPFLSAPPNSSISSPCQFSTGGLYPIQQRGHHPFRQSCTSCITADGQHKAPSAAVMLPAALTSCFCPGLILCSQSAPHSRALSLLLSWEAKGGPMLSSLLTNTSLSVGGVSCGLFKGPNVTRSHGEPLHLWHILCCSTICSISVLPDSEGNTITSTFFWVTSFYLLPDRKVKPLLNFI